MNWKEEMRMGMKLIKDACTRAGNETKCYEEGCPYYNDCKVSPGDYPQNWEYDANGELL